MTDPRPGDVIAGHRLLSVIGRGGMSVVFLAEHIELRRNVALKVLGAQLAEDDAFRERFIRESRMAAALDHPNIVTVYDAGEADGLLYISMRNVKGTDLERLLRAADALIPGRAVALVSQAAAALDAAHDAGLVHRDVKPGNILLTTDPVTSVDHAFLSDFGVTKRVETGAGLTRSGQFVGTVDYVAPEQIQDRDVDGRADVYSLGCVLYRCLVGEVPFPRETEIATIYAQVQDPPPVPSQQRPDLSPGFDAPIARALAKSREDRFATCIAFADAAGEVVKPRRTSPVAVAAPVTQPRPATARRRVGLVVTGLVVAAAVSVAAVMLWGSDGDDAGPTETESPSPSSPSPEPVPTLAWTPVVEQRAFVGPGDQAIAGATVVNGTVVAVGLDDAGDDTDAAAWTSPDGSRWTRAGALGRIGDQRMRSVADIGHGLVAVGSEQTGGDIDAAVWRSSDRGSSWTRIEGAPTGLHGTGDQAMEVVVEAVPGLVAAGWDTANGDLDAAMWTSEDGSNWRREAMPLPGDQRILGATTRDAAVIMVGSTTSEQSDLDAAIWVREGDAWTSIDDDALRGPGDQQIEAVTVSAAGGLVAVGWTDTDGGTDAAVWTSSDGRNWDRVASTGTALATDGDQRMSSVASAGTTLVAAGTTEVAGAGTDVAIWLSTDGILWEPASAASSGGDGSERIASLVALGPNRILATGSRGMGGNEQAAARVARLS